ncbi:A/G-specific adenine glycosylase [soil metagenome]
MEDFSKILRAWYRKKGRDLPWRSTSDPYKIWLSEIILQQTRVDQGTPYYHRFIDNFQTINDLANAHEDKVLRLWQGLGYYSRARNLHHAAKQLKEQHQGKFPANYSEIRALKGIGDYTAAAIASFAFNLPHAVVDGNVYRFLSRFFGITTAIDSSKGKKQFAELADSLLDHKHAATHNQAIMEIGAMICKPKNPLCEECPFIGSCAAYHKGLIAQLPVKEKKLKVRTRYFHYLIIHDSRSVLIASRQEKDIWQGLFEFPLLETEAEAGIALLRETELWKKLIPAHAKVEKVSSEKKHLLSHQTLKARFWWINIDKFQKSTSYAPFLKVDFASLDHYGMPQLIVKYIDEEGGDFMD